MRELGLLLGGIALLIVLLIGCMMWTYQDFSNKCLAAGGTLVTSSVCLPR